MAAGSGWAGKEAVGRGRGGGTVCPWVDAGRREEGGGQEGRVSIPRIRMDVFIDIHSPLSSLHTKTQKHIEIMKVGPAQMWI